MVHGVEQGALFHHGAFLKGGILDRAGDQRCDLIGVGRLQGSGTGDGNRQVLPRRLVELIRQHRCSGALPKPWQYQRRQDYNSQRAGGNFSPLSQARKFLLGGFLRDQCFIHHSSLLSSGWIPMFRFFL